MVTRQQRQIRRAVLSRLHTHLRDVYNYEGARETFIDGTVSLGELESILAFKSDPILDELLCVLERMATGTFGQCIGCKRSIASILLLQDPARRLCELCEEHVSHHAFIEASQQPHVIL
jgi:RNA polymerase-binding transcription factor DksA